MTDILLALLIIVFGSHAKDPELMWAAQSRANYMAVTQQCSHNGYHAYNLVLQSGQQFTDGGEVVACNNYPNSADAAVRGWYSSPAHAELLYQPNLTQIGIGYAVGKNGMRYWSVVVTD